ncbi:unnamed protein product [Linum tenue]|uniref:Uncharacterized protein n=1 Tax=Linum tenue TaxID=586396 RepID=A0AAV0K9Z5_9ROSI|nr:unnamed protein product [Linum tenue]
MIGFPPKRDYGKEQGKRRPERGSRASPQAAQVDSAEGSLLGLLAHQLAQLKQLLNADFKKAAAEPASNMAGLTIQEADWDG